MNHDPNMLMHIIALSFLIWHTEPSNQAAEETMSSIQPFRIDVPQKMLDDLRARLQTTRWPDVLDAGSDKYGPSLKYVQGLTEKFLNDYDWRREEAELNKLPQYVTMIDGQRIHFIQVKAGVPNARPLLLIHGWPGSFVEFLDVIGPLTDPLSHGGQAGEAFDVVIPTLPGFGFSGPTREEGWNNTRIAKALLELMTKLGYKRFGVQGGDVGAIIGPEIARIAPSRVIGVHVNAATIGFIPMGPVEDTTVSRLTPSEKERLERLQNFMNERFGFNMIQSQQPQLPAYALSDSPAGLMAWIGQLFDGSGLERPFLTNFVIYWCTGTVASSMRLYYENAHDPGAWAPRANSGVPTGVAVFQDADVALRSYGEAGNTIVRWKEYSRGGHFPSLTVPDVFVSDLREFFRGLDQ